jgi:hypothetical protein
VASAKQRAANRSNSLKSSGPRSEEGKFRSKLNASKHGLSLPVDERVFAEQIKSIAQLLREDCETYAQAVELAKRIIDFERNEEIKFLEGFLRLESNAILGRIRAGKNSQLSALRYQKRAINQLVKGVRTVARGEDF